MAQVVAIVGGDQRDAGPGGECGRSGADLVLDLEAVVLDLEEEVLRPEDLAVGERGPRRALGVVGEEVAADLALGTRRQGDQPLGVRGEDFVVHARLVVEALEEGERGEPHQVAKAPLVARQQDQVVGAVAGAVAAAPAGDVRLHPDDRLDARLARRLIELDRPEQRAVVGEGQGRHRQLGGARHHALDGARAVEQRIVAVVVEVDEVGMVHGASCAAGMSARRREPPRFNLAQRPLAAAGE